MHPVCSWLDPWHILPLPGIQGPFIPCCSHLMGSGEYWALHTQLDPGNPNYCPCSVEDLLSQEHIHYWALGHIHQPRIVRLDSQLLPFQVLLVAILRKTAWGLSLGRAVPR